MEENSNGINFEKFYKASINYLSFRPRSEKEVRDYLVKKLSKAKSSSAGKKPAEEQLINSIIDSLKRTKFINDEEFARRFVEQRTKIKPRAWRVIKFELKQKGISEELIDQIQNSEFKDKNNDIQSALMLAESKLRKIHDQSDKYKVREKLGRYLAGKGFDWDTVKEVIDKVLGK